MPTPLQPTAQCGPAPGRPQLTPVPVLLMGLAGVGYGLYTGKHPVLWGLGGFGLGIGIVVAQAVGVAQGLVPYVRCQAQATGKTEDQVGHELIASWGLRQPNPGGKGVVLPLAQMLVSFDFFQAAVRDLATSRSVLLTRPR